VCVHVQLADMKDLGVWEPFVVKTQSIKTAVESACMLLRIDDVVAGSKKAGSKKNSGGGQQAQQQDDDDAEGAHNDDRME
jgi:T-complex protein 1 subunit gamma